MKRSGPIPRRTPMTRSRLGSVPAFARVDGADQVVAALASRPKRGLRQKRSTDKPSKAEAARIDRLKRGNCLCCWMNRQNGLATAYFGGCDAHHVLSGGRRRGHLATLGLCPWHHRAVRPYESMSETETTDRFGPSLARGSKPFHAMYGSDDELLDLQEQLLPLDTDAQEAP